MPGLNISREQQRTLFQELNRLLQQRASLIVPDSGAVLSAEIVTGIVRESLSPRFPFAAGSVRLTPVMNAPCGWSASLYMVGDI
jgi:hypothetical protein